MWASMLHRALATNQLRRIEGQLPEQDQKVVARPVTIALEANIAILLEALVEGGYDPWHLPSFPVGRPNPAKLDARSGAARRGLSGQAFERVWDEMRRRGIVKDDHRRT